MSQQLYIHYGDTVYMLVDRRAEEVERELEEALRRGEPYWLDANYGEGRPSRARILIMPGIPLVLRQDTDDAP